MRYVLDRPALRAQVIHLPGEGTLDEKLAQQSGICKARCVSYLWGDPEDLSADELMRICDAVSCEPIDLMRLTVEC